LETFGRLQKSLLFVEEEVTNLVLLFATAWGTDKTIFRRKRRLQAGSLRSINVQ
jgi:hypothetical protein